MSESRMKPLFLDTSGMSVEDMEQWGTDLMWWSRALNWYLGDLARAAHAKMGDDNYSQVFPPDASPGAIQRWEAVAKAYPTEDSRNSLATWTIHAREANRPDRIQRVQAHVDAGRTSDEAAKANREERANDNRPRWLLAFDTHYFLHRTFFAGAGVEAAMQVAEWTRRTVDRLKEKGATDVLCAFEGHGSFRKELTTSDEWAEHRYKDRPPKPDDLKHQLHLVRELLEGFGYCCVSVDRYEADDVLASAANLFPGKTTILTADKDLRQALSPTCNILLDVEWIEDETSGEAMPNYKWLTAAMHTEATGIPPDKWDEYQCIMGDTVDGIQGVAGVGEKGAVDLIKEFGSVEACIEAARAGDERIKPKKREALIEFEGRLEVTRRLVTLATGLPLPTTTRI